MRIIVGTFAVAALVGCSTTPDVALEHRSAQDVQARGIAFDDGGMIANVGMANTTCDIETASGIIQSDYNYGAAAEIVVDGGELPAIGPVNVVLTPDEVHLTTPFAAPYQSSYPVDGVVDAGLAEDGFVAATSDGRVIWAGIDGSVQQQVEAAIAPSRLEVDRATGDAYIATPDGVVAVTRTGERFTVAPLGDALIAWDASTDLLYVAADGGTVLEAYDPGGALRWSVELPGAIRSLSEVGSTARVVASVDQGAGGAFVFVDGNSGTITSELPTPSAARSIEVSGNGEVLAVALSTSLHFFDVQER